MQKKTIEVPEIRSDEVSEIMSKAPIWVVRWGITAILFIIVLILTGASFISYDEIVPGRITITTLQPPAYLEARTSGRIAGIFVDPDEQVGANQKLLEIENSASSTDIYALIEILEGLAYEQDSLTKDFSSELSLGEVQPTYFQFLRAYDGYLRYQQNTSFLKEENSLSKQLNEQKKLLTKKKREMTLFEAERKLSEKSFNRTRELLDSGIISELQFEVESRIYFGDLQRVEALSSQRSNILISMARLENSRDQAALNHQNNLRSNQQALFQSIQDLRNAILDWELKYIIKSPIAGKITLFDIWSEHQNVQAGTVLFTVVPSSDSPLYGRMVLPLQNSGRVKNGQGVIIKVDNYPYQEWGSLRGIITNISAVPKKGLAEYTVQVNIESLETSFDKTLEFKQEMQGSAEIVTEKLTILERVFYQLRTAIARN